MKENSDQMMEFVDNVQQLGIVSGSSQQAMKYGLLQLSQGLTQGVLRAQEFNSILENLPAVAVEIAKAMNVNVGELRQMVVAGKVLSKDVFEAILSRTEQINAQFALMEVTLPRAFQSAKNEALLLIRELDKAGGVSEKLAKVIQAAADKMAEYNEELGKVPDRSQVARDLSNELDLEHRLLAAKREAARTTIEDLNVPRASQAYVEAAFLLLETEIKFRELEAELAEAVVKARGLTAPSPIRGRAGEPATGGLRPPLKVPGFGDISEATIEEEKALARRFGTTIYGAAFEEAAKAFEASLDLLKGAGGAGDLLPRRKPEPPEDLTALPGLEKILAAKNKQIGLDRIRIDMFDESKGAILEEVEAYKMINDATKQLSDLVKAGIITDTEANNILEAKIPLSHEVAAALGMNADAYEALSEAQKASEEALAELVARADGFANIGADALGDWILGFSTAEEAAASLLSRLAEMVLELTVLTPLANALSNALTGGGKAGGSFLSNMFAATFGGARAAGGPTQVGSSYWVGERGPALHTTGASGYIHNARKSREMAQGSGGGESGPTVVMNFPDSNPEEFMRSRSAIRSSLSRAFG